MRFSFGLMTTLLALAVTILLLSSYINTGTIFTAFEEVKNIAPPPQYIYLNRLQDALYLQQLFQYLLFIMSALLFIFCFFTLRSSSRQIRKKFEQRYQRLENEVAEHRKTEQQLRQQKELLQERIEERTEALYHSHKILKHELLERKEIEKALAEQQTLLAKRIAERTSELSAANAELARTARLKDQFLANMSHELRTPLSAILGFTELLQEQVQGELNELQLKSLHTIEKSAQHLLSVINDILDVSKIEAGKLELDIFPLSIEQLCHTSLQFIKQMARQKNIALSLTLDKSVPSMWADERRLKQILVNLLTNAIKFTLEGGQVGLEVTSDYEREVIHFTVWDTGIGIAADDMKHLFKSFSQVEGGLARQYGGTGLGLVLVSRLTELHQGSISLESEPGKGSRFTVSLPWQRSNELDIFRSQFTDEPEHNDGVAERDSLILLVEDNEQNIETFETYLTTKGYQVIVARHGLEAIQRVKEEQPALILMDIQMPKMDGLEAIRHIRADSTMADIPIIALTALAMRGDKERCLAAGANDYLSKPVSIKKLRKKIEQYLTGVV
jgi:signal transduction histidine kinase/ActR/RegA family two-component response regulator